MSQMFVHVMTIQRSTAGGTDEYNQPTNTYADLATVSGLVQPKSSDEVAQANQQGAVVSDHSIYLPLSTDVTSKDRIVFQSETYEIDGIEKRNYGNLGHLKLNARKVTV